MDNSKRYNMKMVNKYSTKEFEEKYTYTGDDLGASWTKDKTVFKIWSPVADKMLLNLYRTGNATEDTLISSQEMKLRDKGVWTACVDEDIKNVYYTYTSVIDGVSSEFCDPYAKACGVNGKRAMVINLEETNPDNWDEDRNPNEKLPLCESFIYELHTRDFSADKS